MRQSHMSAAVLHSLNAFPEQSVIPVPMPSDSEALIRVEACALNRRDDWIRMGLYPNIELPSVLGSDVSGVVMECGAAPEWIGKRVVLCPSLNWGGNTRHQSSAYQILGMPSQGGLAEYICHPVNQLVEVPKHLSHAQAAAFSLAGLTAWRALMVQGGLTSEHRVLITGAGGGVGSLATRFALSVGSQVWVTSGKMSVIETAIAEGACGGASYMSESWWKALPKGMDLIIDGSGGDGFGRLVSLLGMGGRLVFYGGTNGKWPSISPQHLFFKQAAIIGSTMGSPVSFKDMWAHIAAKQLVPTIDSCWPLAKVKAAFGRLLSTERSGKVVIEP